MVGPLRSDGSEVDCPPKRSELDSSPLPVPWGGGGVGFAAFGVGAEDDDFDGALISGICCLGISQTGSTSIAPSIPAAVDAGCLAGEDC